MSSTKTKPPHFVTVCITQIDNSERRSIVSFKHLSTKKTVWTLYRCRFFISRMQATRPEPAPSMPCKQYQQPASPLSYTIHPHSPRPSEKRPFCTNPQHRHFPYRAIDDSLQPYNTKPSRPNSQKVGLWKRGHAPPPLGWTSLARASKAHATAIANNTHL